MKESFYDFKAKDILGNEVSMNDFKDKVVLIVNVASACYFTPQYKGMEKLYKSFSFGDIITQESNACQALIRFLYCENIKKKACHDNETAR